MNASRLSAGDLGAAVAAGPAGTTVATVWITDVRSLAFRLRRSGALDRSFGRGGIARVARLG